MEKFNRYWMLKYAEHREQLKSAISSLGIIPVKLPGSFDSAIVYEVSYPPSYKGPQMRYVGAFVCFDSYPVGVIIKRLSSDEIKRLFLYYQCDKTLCHQ